MRTTILLLSALLVGGVAAPAAQATEYAIFTIKNPTSSTVHYQVKWGDGEWRSYSVAAWTSIYHYYPLNANRQAPRPYVSFDYVLVGPVLFKDYWLNFHATRNPRAAAGKPYSFKVSPCGGYLDLYAD